MTQRRKWILLPLAALAALAIVLLVLFDWNWLKGPLESRVSAALDREFRIAGELDVDLGLAPRITLQDVRLANAPWASDQPMLQVARAEAVIDLRSLWQGEILIPEVALTKPSLLLETGPEGKTNWQFRETADQGPPAIPAIGKLEVSDASLRYRDLASGRTVEARLSRITGTTEGADGGVALSATGEMAEQALELSLDGPSLTRLEQSQPYPLAIDLRLGESDLGGELTLDLFRDTPAVQATLASDQVLTGDLAPLLAAAAPTAEDERSAAADPGPALATDDDQAASFDFDGLPAISLDLQYAARRIEGPELSINDVSLIAGLHDRLPTAALTANGRYRGQPVVLDVRAGPAEGERQQTPYSLEAQIEAGQTRITASGGIERPERLQGLQVDFEGSSTDATELLRQLGIDVPELPQVQASGQLTQQGEVWRLGNLYAQVSESDVAGQISVDLSGPRPFIDADLESSRLRARDLVAVPGEQQPRSEPTGPTEPAGDAEGPAPLLTAAGINFDALPKFDANLRFRGDDVEVPEIRFERLRLDLKLRDRVAVIDAAGQGRFREYEPVTFEVHAGTEESLKDPEARYPVDVTLEAGETTASARGTVDRPLDYTGLDIDVALGGPDLQLLGAVLQLPLPATPPFDLAGKITHQKEQKRWNLVALRGMVGDSDLGGDVSLELGGPRLTIVADLSSEKLDFDDLGVLVGAPPDTGPGETASPEQRREAAQRDAEPRVLPDTQFRIPELRAFDARVAFNAGAIQARKLPLERMSLDLTLEDGTVSIDQLRLELADGQLEATGQLEGRNDALRGQFDLAVRQIRINQLLSHFDVEIAEIELEREGVGTFGGRAQLEVEGNSIHRMAASAGGELSLIMDGGRINALILEAVGLDVGEAVALLLSGDEEEQSEMVPVQCLVSRFDIQEGVMDAKALVLETSDATITGKGQIDLGQETLSLELLAHPKDASVLSASTPVRIEGTFKEPKVDLISEELQEKGLAALALGVVLPIIGAILPFTEEGGTPDTNCQRLIEGAAGATSGGSPPEPSE